jgi:hypothetical protein
MWAKRHQFIFTLALTVAIASSSMAVPQSPKADWRRLEADNGQVYAVNVASIIRERPFAEVFVYRVEGECPTWPKCPLAYQTLRFRFHCSSGSFSVDDGARISPMTYAPPRSVAAQIGALACAGPGKP